MFQYDHADVYDVVDYDHGDIMITMTIMFMHQNSSPFDKRHHITMERNDVRSIENRSQKLGCNAFKLKLKLLFWQRKTLIIYLINYTSSVLQRKL